ncbi:MAG: TrbC/VirB2 family protein [Bacilli bacterium]|nr:TrbC/VirB2 family protein [Bacilli bacterium]
MNFNTILAATFDRQDEVQALVNNIVSIILWAITAIGVIIVIAIGFQFMTQQQAEERQKLKSRLIWFAIGTGIVFSASLIWQILQSIFLG